MHVTPRRRHDTVKRLSDVLAAGGALLALAPVIALCALAIRLTIGSPVLFKQSRPGLDGKLFTIIKFRTMREGPGSDADRMTRLGSNLRSTSLDELPSLWNILRGDMSLVGPRPLLPRYLDLYSDRQMRRHEVRPGLTGLAQINGRNDVGWPERLEHDVQYVQTRSLRMDLDILVRTIRLVLAREGISADGESTMAPFEGEGNDD